MNPTKPYSATEFIADPGFNKYDTDPKPKPRLRFVPKQGSTDILMLNEDHPGQEHAAIQEGMSTLYPMPVEEGENGMDTYTTLYVGSLSIVGLYILFRVLYR
jgi:hypothetical protein